MPARREKSHFSSLKILNVIVNFVYVLGLKFGFNYQNKILFLLRRGRILFKVKIKIFKIFGPRKTAFLNFVLFIRSFLGKIVRGSMLRNFSPREETGKEKSG